MSITEPNVSNIFSGQVAIYLAAAASAIPLAAGSPPPFFTAKPAASDWLSAGFIRAGFTDSGLDLVTTPSSKDITPDELITPAKQIITGVKAEAKCTLLETHIENLAKAIALSTLSNPGTGIKTMGVGSGNPLTEYVLAAQGASTGGSDSRVLVCWRVNVTSAITQSYLRKDVSKLACTFSALSDSSKPTPFDVYCVTDFGAGS